ncbi:hypothetical protein JL721_3270 [Aureococcus anophagefferens]|nr:hypothetical protein JL721_3270 [Aureococcus anophagefferens]
MWFVGRSRAADAGLDLDAMSLGRSYFNVTCFSVSYGLISAMRTLCPRWARARAKLHGLYAQRALCVVAVGALGGCAAIYFAEPVLVHVLGQQRALAKLARRYCVGLLPSLAGVSLMTILQRIMTAEGHVVANLAICAAVCATAPAWQYVLIERVFGSYVGAAWASSAYNCTYLLLQATACVASDRRFFAAFAAAPRASTDAPRSRDDDAAAEAPRTDAAPVYDSRGNPTVEVEVTVATGAMFSAIVPSGASTGIYEACELRDGGKAFMGKGVLTAVKNVVDVLGPLVKGMDCTDQKALDEAMIAADGTPNKSKLGANAILGVFTLPMPCFNVINGGSHAGNKLAFQEYFVIPPGAASMADGSQIATEVYHNLKKIIKDDWDGWTEMTAATPEAECQIVGDDLTVTNVARIKAAVEEGGNCSCSRPSPGGAPVARPPCRPRRPRPSKLMRHGESEWNKKNLFTGWVDVALTPDGEKEGEGAASLKAAGLAPDMAFTSALQRAQRIQLASKTAGLCEMPVASSWRLNERHYGSLQGLDKAETVEKHGKDQVQVWRRSYDVPPPDVAGDSEHHPANDAKYCHVPPAKLPAAESLEMTRARVLPYWNGTIKPVLATGGKTVLVCAHGNSLRALLMELDGVDKETIPGINIPTGTPLVYDLDASLKVIPKAGAVAPLNGAYLGDAAEVAAMAGRRSQTDQRARSVRPPRPRARAPAEFDARARVPSSAATAPRSSA